MRRGIAWMAALLAAGWTAPGALAERYPEPRFDAARDSAVLRTANAPGPAVLAGAEGLITAVGPATAQAPTATEVPGASSGRQVAGRLDAGTDAVEARPSSCERGLIEPGGAMKPVVAALEGYLGDPGDALHGHWPLVPHGPDGRWSILWRLINLKPPAGR